MVSDPPKPLPVPDESSAGFWAASAEHVLVMQRCGGCGRFTYPPRVSCTGCGVDASEFSWQPVSGDGHVRTWTVMRTAFLPGFADDLPYLVADVELAEQPRLRMAARLKGVGIDEIEIGLPVQVAFDDVGDGVSIPYFVPRES